MERHTTHFDRDYVKMAMLRQEEIFRHQVHELHRLYRVQKKLMRDAKEAEMNSQRFDGNGADMKQQCFSFIDPKPPSRKFVPERPAEKHTGKSNGDTGPELQEEGDLELTLAIGGSRIRRKARETPFASDSESSFSSSSSESEMAKFNSRNWGSFQASGASMARLRHEQGTGFDIEGRLRQDGLKQPPWLSQHLSLNMTS